MGKRGPPPKPTHLKLLQGNPGKQAINRNEPQPERASTLPPAPGMLTGYAVEEWDRAVAELYHMRLLARVDTQILAAYCTSYSIWRTAVETFDASAKHFPDMHRLVVRKANGDPIQNPLLRTIHDAAAAMARYAAAFGFTPAARSSIIVPREGQGAESKFTGLLSG